jgi:hypothetical protein
MNVRVSRVVPIAGRVRVEAIAEVFNLFNAKNPALPMMIGRLSGGAPNGLFMQTTTFAVGQIGFRLTF